MNIVFDIGGTNMRVASAEGETLGEIKKVPTPKDPKEGIATFARIARELGEGAIEKIAGDFPGRVRGGVVSGARNLPQWVGTNIEQDLTKVFSVDVHVVNDGILVGYGELHKGAGRGFKKVAYITVSTGAGGALIDEANLVASPQLADLELKIGDLETQISGTAVQKKFGIPPKELDSLDERNKLADILAAGLAEIAEKWKPDVFVLGGSMIVGVNPIPLERVREKFTAVPVKMAELGDNGGLIGAAILAAQK